VRSALLCVDVVHEREHIFQITVVVLNGDFHHGRVFDPIDINGLGVKNVLGFVQMFHKGDDPAIELIFLCFAVSLIAQRNEQPPV